jgi:hypothetical protein
MTMLQMMWNTSDKPERLQFQAHQRHSIMQSNHQKTHKNNKRWKCCWGGGIFFEKFLQIQGKYVIAIILEISKTINFFHISFRRTDCQNLHRKQIYTAVR